MGEIFEMCMVILFGVSWPVNIFKSYKSKTAKGKSVIFLILIFLGYLSGIIGKIVTNNITYVLIFYVLNIVMVAFDIFLFYRNKKIDNKKLV